MELKHTTKTIFEVDGFDLTNFICNHYGCTRNDYDFSADQEMGNGDEKSFSIGKEELDDFEQAIIDDKKFNYGFITRILLTDLCNKDLIEEGDYLVSLFW